MRMVLVALSRTREEVHCSNTQLRCFVAVARELNTSPRRLSVKGGLFTETMIEGYVQANRFQQALCDRPGRSPCDLDVYAESLR